MSKKNVIIIIISLMLVASAGGVYVCKKHSYNPLVKYFTTIEQSRNFFIKAKEYQDNGEYKKAYYTYNKIPSSYKAYDMVLFNQAICASGIADEKTAILKFKKILKQYSKSLLVAEISYKLGQAYIRNNDFERALKQFNKTIINYPDTEYSTGSLYYIGQLNLETNPQIAFDNWLKYIKIAPKGRFSNDCVDGIISVGSNLTSDDKKYIAIALYWNEKYKQALKYFKYTKKSETWFYQAMSYKNLKSRRNALSMIEEGLKKYSKNTSSSKIRQAMKSYAKLSRFKGATDWARIIDFTSNDRDFAYYNKTKYISNTSALGYYKKILVNYPKSDYASESLWYLFWNCYKNKYYTDAIKLGEKHLTDYTNTQASPRILFWLGKIYEKKKNKNLAISFYKRLLAEYTDSYYSFRAYGRLKKLNGQKDIGWNINKDNVIVQDVPTLPYSYQEIEKAQGSLVAELVLLKDYDNANKYISDMPFLASWIKYKQGQITRSIVLARNEMSIITSKPSYKDNRWKLIYQIHYEKEINHYAKLRRVDPYIALSLMKEESHFNPLAISSSRARGLMQLMPATARDVTRWNNYKRINNYDLFNPETNIKLGVTYISHVKDDLGKMMYAVGSYNCGPTAMKRWVKSTKTRDLDEFVENIPYRETKKYIKKVYRSYWNYRNIYD